MLTGVAGSTPLTETSVIKGKMKSHIFGAVYLFIAALVTKPL